MDLHIRGRVILILLSCAAVNQVKLARIRPVGCVTQFAVQKTAKKGISDRILGCLTKKQIGFVSSKSEKISPACSWKYQIHVVMELNYSKYCKVLHGLINCYHQHLNCLLLTSNLKTLLLQLKPFSAYVLPTLALESRFILNKFWISGVYLYLHCILQVCSHS